MIQSVPIIKLGCDLQRRLSSKAQKCSICSDYFFNLKKSCAELEVVMRWESLSHQTEFKKITERKDSVNS